MLFDLLQELATEMLAGAQRPAELRSLLGTLRMLKAVRSGQAASRDTSCVANDTEAAEREQSGPAETGPAADPDPAVLEIPPIRDLRRMAPFKRLDLVNEFRRRAQQCIDSDSLSPQQLSQLKRQLVELRSAGM